MEVYPSPAEGIGLENRQGGQTPRGFESLYLLHFLSLYNNFTVAGWSNEQSIREKASSCFDASAS